MKKFLTTLTLLFTLCTFSYGQYMPYFPNVISDESHMNIGYGSIYIDGTLYTNVDYIEIAAYINDKVSGRQLGITNALKSFPISGNSTLNGSNIIFKCYNHLTQELLISTTSLQYEDKENLGKPWDPFVINFEPAIAQIGETKYATLAAAVEAADNNETITLLKNAEGAGVVINKSITIDFNEKTYTFTTPAVGSTGTTTNGFQILNGNTVTLQNGTLNVADANKGEYYILIQNYANLNVNKMTLDGTNLDKYSATDGDSYTLSNNSGTVNISNSKIIANNEGDLAFALDACKYANYTAPIVNLAGDVDINGNVELNGGQINHTQTIYGVAKKSFKGGAYWGTISTPIKDAAIPTAVAGKHDLYRYDEPSMMWNYYNDGQNDYTTLELGRGYLYTNTNDITIELKGSFNVSDVQFPLSYTEGKTLAGFNMIGNPFAHNITDGNMIPDVELAGGFYVISENGGWIAKTSGTIAPMEAVLVKATAPNGTLVINPTSTSKRNATDNGVIAISASNANYSDVAYVSFNEGIGLDKINHHNANIPMVYVPVEGVNYAIAMMNQDVTEIPVSFKAATMGEYTISAEAQNCEYSRMTLVDRQTGIETNLLLEDYSFIAKTGDNADRFFIRLDNSQQSEDNSHFAYINNGMINIDEIEGQGVVSIYDITGRPVAEYNVATSANIATSDFAAGVYVIRMSDENGIKVQKIVIE